MDTSGSLLILKTVQCLSLRDAFFGHVNPVLLQGRVQIMSITNQMLSSGLCFVTKQSVGEL